MGSIREFLYRLTKLEFLNSKSIEIPLIEPLLPNVSNKYEESKEEIKQPIKAKKMFSLGKQSLDTLKGVHPDLVKVMMEAIKESPVDFTITDGGRTTAMQQALYAKGRTKPGHIVTKADGVRNKSNHQAWKDGYYHAVDLYPYVNGNIDFDDKANRLSIIAPHIIGVGKKMGIKIEWGGKFLSINDKPHFQLP